MSQTAQKETQTVSLDDFEVGQQWLTRDGQTVEILAVCDPEKTTHPVIGVTKSGRVPSTYTLGGYWDCNGNPKEEDLVSKIKPKLERWFRRLKMTGSTSIISFDTEEEALAGYSSEHAEAILLREVDCGEVD